MTKQTKIQILGALLLVWGGAVVFQYLDETEQANSALTSHNTAQGSLFNLNPDSLTLAKSFTNPREHITLATPRNIFSPFHLRPNSKASSKKPAPPKITPMPKKTQPIFVPPPGPSPEELARQRAQQQLQQFRFLGYLKKGGESQAFLTKGQSIYIVKQGATVEGRIMVNRIDPTLVILSTKLFESGDLVKAEIPLTRDSQRS